MALIKLCAANEVALGQTHRIVTDEAALCVYHLAEGFFATDDRCTHADVSLADGYIEGSQIVCPRHSGSFNILTGVPTRRPCTRALRTFDVTHENGWLFVESMNSKTSEGNDMTYDKVPGFDLTSPAFKDGGRLPNEQVFNGFGCTGPNVSPELHWSGVPASAKSLALTLYDPDAPTGSGWWHWVVYNIPVDVSKLAAGAGNADGSSMSSGVIQGRTDYGYAGFGGACPPPGDKPHRYVFSLHALNTDKIELPEGASAALVGFMIHQHRIATAQLTALFSR